MHCDRLHLYVDYKNGFVLIQIHPKPIKKDKPQIPAMIGRDGLSVRS